MPVPHGYQPLPTSDNPQDASAAFDYKSIHKYNPQTDNTVLDIHDDDDIDYPRKKQSFILVMVTHVVTVLSYIVFVVFFPIMYWVCIRKLGQSDRLIVFRLGKLLGTKGPGRVLVFPWMDRCQRVDMRVSAFSVPPQQFITFDGGIVEVGAEVQFGITDPVAMVKEVADHQDILRSLGKTLVIRLLVKKSVLQLQKEKKICGQEIMDEMNSQVRKWGLDIHCVSLSEAKVLKVPEANAGLNPILQNFGLKGPTPYPTPIEFARNACEPAASETRPDQRAGIITSTNSDLCQLITAAESGLSKWRPCLEAVIQQENLVDEDSKGLYHVQVTDMPGGDEEYLIQISEVDRALLTVEEGAGATPNVKVKISSSDLAGVLKGSLPPLQAYLTGRISATGDVRKLMLFDKMSNRGHRPGQTFSI